MTWIVDPTVIQLKTVFRGHCIIKINPDYIKLCWNRPQLFALLKQLLKSSSRRYIWVLENTFWVSFCFLNVNGEETLCSAQSAWGSWKLRFSDSKSLIPEMKEKKKPWDFLFRFHRKIRRKTKLLSIPLCHKKKWKWLQRRHGLWRLYVLVFWLAHTACEKGLLELWKEFASWLLKNNIEIKLSLKVEITGIEKMWQLGNPHTAAWNVNWATTVEAESSVKESQTQVTVWLSSLT